MATVSRESPVTGQMIEVPVCVSLVGADGKLCSIVYDYMLTRAGTDQDLIDIVERTLRQNGRSLEVQTGAVTFGK